MRISKRTAIGISGLVFAGAAAVGVGSAIPANAKGCCGGGHSKNYGSVSVNNRNFNFSRSDSEQAQRANQRQHHFNEFRRFDFEENKGKGKGW